MLRQTWIPSNCENRALGSHASQSFLIRAIVESTPTTKLGLHEKADYSCAKHQIIVGYLKRRFAKFSSPSNSGITGASQNLRWSNLGRRVSQGS